MCQGTDMRTCEERNYVFHDIAVARLHRIRRIDEVIYEVMDNK